MTDAKSEPQEAGKAPGLTLNLSSNNPFRNRAASPNSIPKSPASPFDDPSPRPVSRNPFLDPAAKPTKSPDNMATKDRASPTAEEIFDNLTLDDKEPNKERRPMPAPGRGPPRGPPGPMGRGGPPRDRENMPPPGRRAPPRHRPTRSQEEALRARRMQGGSSGGPGSSMSPHRRPDRRPRRNSESSIASGDKILTEEEKKARDARRRERERRHRERESSSSKDKPPKSNKRMDIIDQLDATSIFGTGLFHHDGPFDALNPHRNRQGSRRAPMQAFPKDSLNNVLGGSGPLNARPDHATFMGTADEEGYKDYNNGVIPSDKMGSSSHMPPVFDPLSRSHVVHGDETFGLGTSTFLEGTPAARSTVQRHDAEMAQQSQADGLSRKKSLAQRIRGINSRPQRDFSASGRMTNPEGAMRSPPTGGPTSSSYNSGAAERNPFFNEFDRKGGEENISIRRADTIGVATPMSPGSPGRGNTGRGMGPGLERRATVDSAAQEEQPKSGGGGLLARVKSLKGGRRTRPPEPTAAAPPPPPAGRDA